MGDVLIRVDSHHLAQPVIVDLVHLLHKWTYTHRCQLASTSLTTSMSVRITSDEKFCGFSVNEKVHHLWWWRECIEYLTFEYVGTGRFPCWYSLRWLWPTYRIHKQDNFLILNKRIFGVLGIRRCLGVGNKFGFWWILPENVGPWGPVLWLCVAAFSWDVPGKFLNMKDIAFLEFNRKEKAFLLCTRQIPKQERNSFLGMYQENS